MSIILSESPVERVESLKSAIDITDPYGSPEKLASVLDFLEACREEGVYMVMPIHSAIHDLMIKSRGINPNAEKHIIAWNHTTRGDVYASKEITLGFFIDVLKNYKFDTKTELVLNGVSSKINYKRLGVALATVAVLAFALSKCDDDGVSDSLLNEAGEVQD